MHPIEAFAVLGTVSIICFTAYGVIRVGANAWTHRPAAKISLEKDLQDIVEQLQLEIDSLRQESAERWDDLDARLDFSENLLAGENTKTAPEQRSRVIGLTPV